MTANFAEFWYRFPRRVGKLAAERAYQAALKRATHEDIMAGVERYIRTKPAYADWCHAKTWLNQGRWLDEPDGVPAAGGLFKTERSDCQHEPRCPGTWQHGKLVEAEAAGDEEAIAMYRRWHRASHAKVSA